MLFGMELPAYIEAGIIFAISLVVAEVVRWLTKHQLKKLVSFTKTDVDDILLTALSRPIFYFIVLAGAYLSLSILPDAAPYMLYIEGGFFVIAVGLAAYMTGKVTSILVPRWLPVEEKFEGTPKLLNKIISAIIYIVAFLIVLSHFGIEITPIIAALGVGGLAIGLALQPTLSHFFAGLHIISDRPIRIGDFVEIGNVSGFVEDISWRSTRIRTLPGNVYIFPNSKLSESIIHNVSMPDKPTKTYITAGVAYGSDLEKVERITLETARHIQQTVPGAMKDFEPFVRFKEFGESNVNFSTGLQVEKYTEKWLVTHEFIKALKKRFNEEGIEISWPIVKVYQA